MTSCLYECLYEVGLQRYYPQFAALGLRRLGHLSQLTMEDYPRLGVQDMMDRTRLFHLVQLVKGIEDEDDSDEKEDRGASTEAVCPSRKPPPCRQLNFSAHSPELTQATRNTCADYTHTPSCRPQTDRETPIRNVHTDRETQRQSSHTPTGTPKRSARIDKKTHRYHTDKVKSRNSKTREEKGLADSSPRKSRLQQEVAQVYRVKRTPFYSYGLPMSSSAFSTRELTGQASVSAAERIRVCVRKRPLSRSEERRGETDVVTAGDRDRVLVHEQKEAVDLTQYVLQHEFYFDEVFSEACTNEDIYKKTAWPLIQHIFNGGKATCFAYGQTGAGKTHTMLGSSPRRPGLYALAAHDIFARLAQPKAGSGSGPVCSLGPIYVCVSFFEIYCGQLYDLLDHRKRLFAREDGQGVVQISGLREVEVQSVAALLEVISWGSRGRSRGMSGVNCDSSRSHALLQIHLRDRMQQLVGRISFVDLAGSERACDTRDPGRQNRMEGAEINQSLLALKECIRALDQEQSHTPFRQSKLTQVLKDSFIGNSKTCMIANISPCHLATEHTLNTLRYANRVKELKRGGKSSPSHGGLGHKALSTPSPKHNKNGIRGKSPSKKVKLGVYGESRGSGPLSHAPPIFSPGATMVCSTPKALAGLGWSGDPEEIHLDYMTPLRGTVARGRGTRQHTGERQEEEEGSEGVDRCGGGMDSARQEVRSRSWARPVWKETVSLETLGGWGRAVGHGDRHHSSTGREGTDTGREEMERERHLRRYHEQLQQFQPSVALLGSRWAQPPVDQLLEEYEEGAKEGRTTVSGQATPLQPKAGEESDSREHPVHSGATEFRSSSGSSRSKGERYYNGPVQISAGARESLGLVDRWKPGARDDTESWEREVDRGSGGPAHLDWSTEDEDFGPYLSSESSSSNNNNNNVPAERPLSPPRANEFLKPEDLNNLSAEFKHTNSPSPVALGMLCGLGDPLCLPFSSPSRDSINIPLSTSTPTSVTPLMENWRRESGTTGPRDVPLTSLKIAKETRDMVSLTGSDPHSSDRKILRVATTTPQSTLPSHDSDSASGADTSTSVMDPLSVSQLQVERRPATDSFLCCASCSPEGDSEERGGTGNPQLLLDALMDVRNYWEYSESAVRPGGHSGQQRVDLDDALLCIKCMSMTKDPTVSLIPFPGSFLDTSAQHKIDGLGLRRAPPPPGVLHTRESAVREDSHTLSPPELSGQSQSEPSTTVPPLSGAMPRVLRMATLLKPVPLLSVSVGTAPSNPVPAQQSPSDPVPEDVQEKRAVPLRRAVLGGPGFAQEVLKSGSPGEGPTAPSYPQITGTTRSLRKGLGLAQRLVVQAHCEQLEEMEALLRREEVLLSSQHSMDFTDYVQKLEEIMELKAKCVCSMRAHLQLYLTCPTAQQLTLTR